MSIWRKIRSWIGLVIETVIVVFLSVFTLFMTLNPQFGGTPTFEQREGYEALDHYQDGAFMNLGGVTLEMDDIWGTIGELIEGNPNATPPQKLPVDFIDSLTIAHKENTLTRLTWFGHSAFLLEVEGKNILLDPMLGKVCAPAEFLGTPRYYDQLPIPVEELPHIDAVVISHDHYDHLDYPTIIKLKDKTDHFFVPLGVGAHLLAWDIPAEKITELNWWDESTYQGFTFACTPSQHFSGRGILDRAATLWASWVIKTPEHNIYFSGDGGYGPHFTEIGERYGPFDFAMMECGQYNKRWAPIHMTPEQTVQASIDVKTRLMMPIHWGAFTLALHDWDDPIKRVTAEANRLNVPIATPRIGEAIRLDQPGYPQSDWWKL